MSAAHQTLKNDPRWKAARKRVLTRDGHQCQACGDEDDLTVDHVLALANGGESIPSDDELTTLCRSCNSRKGNRTVLRVAYSDPAWLVAT